jgi:hypothetical protein
VSFVARHGDCRKRPSPDGTISLLLTPAPGQEIFLRYKYDAGKLVDVRDNSRKKVTVDAFGIPV